jgi:hypothetical protein
MAGLPPFATAAVGFDQVSLLVAFALEAEL